ncbi:VanZ family protein [uncultured Eudoraea sp.]|uniref:VanZ family protein n=1 Tax=uncultured Eudoraea sp. TaxID=1035614 RepID=UPI00262B056E|nr:VanZ family protein [uncultured Eudoraea sp.]
MKQIIRSLLVFKRYGFTIGFICWILIITILSLSSFEDIDTEGINIPHLDKLIHFFFYFVAAILGILLIRERTKGQFKLSRAIIITALSVIIYGIIIEVIQDTFTENRSGELYDVLANSLGAFFGAVFIIILFSGKTQLKWKD